MKHGTERTVECTHECTYPCHRFVLLYHCLKSQHTIQTVWHWLSPLPLSEITAHHSNSLTLTLSYTTVRNHIIPFKQSDIDSLLYHCQKSQLAHHSNCLTLTLSSTTVRNHSTPFSLTLTLSSTTVRNHSTPFKQSNILWACWSTNSTPLKQSDFPAVSMCPQSLHLLHGWNCIKDAQVITLSLAPPGKVSIFLSEHTGDCISKEDCV